MKEIPILFSGPMVRAILEGRKTMTRRICKPAEEAALSFVVDCDDGKWGDEEGNVLFRCPFGQPGDRLWVREAWRAPISMDDLSGKDIAQKCLDAGYRKPWCPIQFESDGARNSEKDWREFGSHPSTAVPGRYRHARFMPRWASRITLEVTGVRAERLQDITEEQARAEGVEPAIPLDPRSGEPRYDVRFERPHVVGFVGLWNDINGAGSWDANPWVWVIEFKRVEGGE